MTTVDREAREWFPQLDVRVSGKRLVYLDSAATTLKPRPVIDAVTAYLSTGTANVHRGAYRLSDAATRKYEDVRDLARKFVNAESTDEIVFTSGTTDGLNLVAHGLGELFLAEGDEILISQMEHHSNIVPWQLAAKRHGAVLRFVPVTADGVLDLAAFKSLLGPRTKVVSLVHLSNALGTINPLRDLFAMARAAGAICVADAAQSVSLLRIDVRELGCDFLVASGHKMFGPTGVGFLYGRRDRLEKMPPFKGGGSMIHEVREDGVEFLPPPHRFEAGTPPIAEVFGLGAAFEFILGIGFERLTAHERVIMEATVSGLDRVGGVRRFGGVGPSSHVLSFTIDGAHPSDIGSILDEQGVAVRAGHHCCQPLMRRLGVSGTVRASFSVYTSPQDIDEFVAAVRKAKELLA